MSMMIDEEKERKQLINRYRRLIRLVTPKLEEGESVSNIRKAFKFAVEAHKDVRRKSGEPYIFHPVAVATIVVEEMGLGQTAVIAALLHDVVEDTELELSDIEKNFGKEITIIIDGLTKITSASAGSKEYLQTLNFRKVLFSIAKDIRVIFIKLADRLHNMRTLGSMSRDKKLKIKSETEFIYAPLAHRLGFYNIKSELEDLSLVHSDPQAYRDIEQSIYDTKEDRDRFIRSFTRPIEKALKNDGLDFKIKSRVKAISSIFQKMKRQQVNFDEVYDLFAIRIIINAPLEAEKAACWKVYSIVTDFSTPNPKRLRDWVSHPKNNGYESLHTTVMSRDGRWVEVQIRTQRMDEIAEMGYAAHHLYKDAYSGKTKRKTRKGDLERGFDQWLADVRESIEKNDLRGMEFLVDFRESNLYGKEVFVFTPRGEIKYLPEGATVLDFAFAVHTEVGANCIGAKINHRIVSLEHELGSGDQVEILTAKSSKVNEDWLQFVATSKARSGIKEYLKKDKKKYTDIGKETIQRKLKQLKLPFDQPTLTKVMKHFDIVDEFDLYFKVGAGVINHTQIKNFHDREAGKVELAIAPDKEVREVKRELKEANESEVFIIGPDTKGIDYSIANCCQPIPGEDIMGFVTIGRGITIHSATCNNATALSASYGYRIVQVRWAETSSTAFRVKLNIQGTDRQGIIQDVTKVVSESLQLNIHALDIKAKGSIFTGILEIEVKELDQLKKLIQKLRALEGVVKVARM